VFEIGINVQPIDVPFTQAAPSQSCQALATITSTAPVTTIFSVTSNTLSGGNVTITGATLLEIGIYTITLSNMSATYIQSVVFTIELKDPCSRAIFEVNPYPF
jgi:hypothetical protein